VNSLKFIGVEFFIDKTKKIINPIKRQFNRNKNYPQKTILHKNVIQFATIKSNSNFRYKNYFYQHVVPNGTGGKIFIVIINLHPTPTP
jgi:hypothetical protein